MTKTETTIRSIDVTPEFNYSRHVEIIKRFTEQLTVLSDPDGEHLGSEAIAYIRKNIPWARRAVSEIMADDIRLQIKDESFPNRAPTIRFHEFIPDPVDTEVCINEGCYSFPTADVHL